MRFKERYIIVITVAMISIIGTMAFTDVRRENGNFTGSYETIENEFVDITTESEINEFHVREVIVDTVGNAEAVPETEPETETETEHHTEGTTETPEIEPETQGPEMWIFTVNGSQLDVDTQVFINQILYDRGIHDWMPVMMCQIYQESRNNHYAEAANGYDKGLLQFRSTYWQSYCDKWGIAAPSIFDSATQIVIYANEISERLTRGETMEQAISDHYTGGIYYDAQYVSDVMQWMACIEKAALGAN